MITYHTPPATLADALNALAERMEQHETNIGPVALANMMSIVLDGPAGNAWQPTSHPKMAKQMQEAIVPNGFLSPVPTVAEVRQAAATARLT